MGSTGFDSIEQVMGALREKDGTSFNKFHSNINVEVSNVTVGSEGNLDAFLAEIAPVEELVLA